MRDTSKVIILLLTFLLGFGCAAGGAAGIAYYAFNNVTINQIQNDLGLDINTDSVIGEYPQVYLRDMTLAGAFNEKNELLKLGDEVNINLLVDRYALILNPGIEKMLSNTVREMPIRQLFTAEGSKTFLQSRYLGDIRGYEMVPIEGTEEPDYWKFQNGERVVGINDILADFTLYDFVYGDIHADAILDKLTFGEMLEYTRGADGEYYKKDGTKVTGLLATVADCHFYDVPDKLNNEFELWQIFGYEYIDGEYYDENGEKVTGIMAVIADSNIHDVPAKIDTTVLSDILGYTLKDGKYYDENGKEVTGVMAVIADCDIKHVQSEIENSDLGEIMGYTYDEEQEWWIDKDGNKVHTFMNSIAEKKIEDMNTLYNDLTIADLIPEEERDEGKGYISLIPPETKLTDISSTVNDVFSDTTMKTFVDCGAITFENDPDGSKAEKFKNSSFGSKTMDEMVSFIFDNLDTLERLGQ